jgi:peptidoglycan pentaglycine glycine transferase (the first glycine)
MHSMTGSLALLSSTGGTLADQHWDAFVAQHPEGHLLQTSRWAALKERFGWSSLRLALVEGDQLVAGGQLLLRQLPWGQSLAYAPKGPLVDWRRVDHVRPLLDALYQAAQARRAALLKLEPDLLDSPLLDLQLRSYGLRRGHGVQPRSTLHVDLLGGSAAVLANMKQKWRYNVRLASRKDIIVRQMSAADFPAFHRLNEETGRRDGFGIHQPAYYETAFDLFPPSDTAQWLIATHAGQPLGAIVVFALGHKSWYMWGASTAAERQRMPNHALQWAGMQWAGTSGCHTYDLWGIPDEVGMQPGRPPEDFTSRDGGLWGVYRFKQGFGGQVVRYTGAWDLVSSQVGYRLYHTARRLRQPSI